MNKHPSGRPIREERVVSRPIWRIPDKGPITPRLQDNHSEIAAIGFTAEIAQDK
jgi:hypothetical protein